MKNPLRFCIWFSICLAITLFGVSLRYLTVAQSLSLWQWGHFVSLASGQFFIFGLIVSLCLIFPVAYYFKSKTTLVWSWLLSSLILTAMVADTFVFQLYRFHLNWAMVDLFINGGSEVIHFSFDMWIQILLLVAGILVGSSALVWVTNFLSNKTCRVLPWSLMLISAFIVGNLSHAYAVALQVTPISTLSESVPGVRPLTMTSFMAKMGWTSEKVEKVKVSENGVMAYPLKPLNFKEAKPLNIVFILSDCLRSDMLNPTNMPYAWKISEENIRFENHYSSGNATRAGIFGLFYGLPPSYWHSVFAAQVPSAFVTSLQKQGYEIEAFASARLTSPEFNKTVFASVPNIRLMSEGNSSWERDVDSVNDFEAWVSQVKKPFFSFIFFDNIHAYSTDPSRKPTFTPAWETVNNLKLNNDLDPTEYFNLYKNAVVDTDRNIERVWNILKDKGLLENTIVIISSDHGEEFNDNHQNYWGHNGNFTDAQIKIPLIVHWPGKEGPKVYEHQTTAYDITATLMPEVLGCTNPIVDYSVGSSLWEPNDRQWFISGSYQSSAIVEENRIVLMNAAGFLDFKDRHYRESENKARTPNLLQAIEEMSRYRQK